MTEMIEYVLPIYSMSNLYWCYQFTGKIQPHQKMQERIIIKDRNKERKNNWKNKEKNSKH